MHRISNIIIQILELTIIQLRMRLLTSRQLNFLFVVQDISSVVGRYYKETKEIKVEEMLCISFEGDLQIDFCKTTYKVVPKKI